MQQPMQITIEEFYIIIGELEVTRRKQLVIIQDQSNQINQMAAEITRLRDGGLEQPNNPE